MSDFSEALLELKRGSSMHRVGWNGPGQFVEMQVPDPSSKMTLPYLYLINAKGGRVPWVPSQSDLLAVDWASTVVPKNQYLPHQHRVVIEKAELDAKIENLRIFMAGKVFSEIYAAEQDRLNDQLRVMLDYSDILTERIEAFND